MIVSTGEALIDFIPHQNEDGEPWYQPSPGGSPFNTVVATARLDVPTAFLGKISTDLFGDQLVDYLRVNKVSTELIVRDGRPTTLAFVKKMPDGQPRYAFFNNGAADVDLRWTDVSAIPASCQAIQFGSISVIPSPVGDTILRLVEEEASRVISFDPNIRTGLIKDEADYRGRIKRAVSASTIVKVSDEDLAWYTGKTDFDTAAASLLESGATLVVLTAGADGAHAFLGGQKVSVAAESVVVSDTVGAGDSFHAAILAWLYHHDRLSRDSIAALAANDLQELLEFAVGVAARTCERVGADPPRLKDL